MPDFHKLNKTKTTEMSKEELNRRLREEAGKSAARAEKLAKTSKPAGKAAPAQKKKQRKISEETKKQMPPQSPARKKREDELKRREKEAEKARKRRRRGNYVIYYVMLGVFVFLVFAIMSVTVLFNANKIVVEGESIYSDEEIIAASGLKGDENLVRLSTSGIPEKILEQLVSLDTAEVIKEFPYTIKIKVTPAVPMVNFYYAGKNYVISHVGRVMQIDSKKADCMEVVGYQPGESVEIGDYITAANPKQDELITQISAAIEKAELQNITRLDISDTLSIVLTYEDRIKITIGSVLQLDEKLKIAKELIENHIAKGEKVSLDITNIEHAVQRPLTEQPQRTVASEILPEEGEETTPKEAKKPRRRRKSPQNKLLVQYCPQAGKCGCGAAYNGAVTTAVHNIWKNPQKKAEGKHYFFSKRY